VAARSLSRWREGDVGRRGAAMRHEARILERLDGPWFPRLVHDGADEEVAYLAIEWLEGLGDFPVGRGAPAVSATAGDELVEGVLALSDAFAELHRRGVVHADVHPRNLLMGESGAHILDFSLSVVPGDEELGTARRGGVLSFYEPEWAAAAWRDGRTRQPPSGATSTDSGRALRLLTGGPTSARRPTGARLCAASSRRTRGPLTCTGSPLARGRSRLARSHGHRPR